MAEDLVRTDATAQVVEHVSAYHKFTLTVKWVMVLAASLIAFLALWFAAGAGFIAGLIVGLIIFGVGTYALRHGWAHSSEDGSLAYPQGR
jgi:thiamine transporter ThiT